MSELGMQELASELGISRARVYQIIKDLGFIDDLESRGRKKILSDEQADLVRNRFNETRNFTKSDVSELDILTQKYDELTDSYEKLKAQLSEANRAIQEVAHQNDVLKERVKGLQQVIVSKDEEIKRLSDSYSNISKALDQQQQLELEHTRAITYNQNQQQNVTESQTEPSIGTTESTRSNEEPKGFFGRLFK